MGHGTSRTLYQKDVMPTADEMLGRSTVADLTRMLDAAAPEKPQHLLDAADQLQDLPMRKRVDLVAQALAQDIGPGYTPLAAAIRETASSHPQDFSGWLIWPVTEAVANAAVADGTEAVFQDALDLLAELTHRFSSEFAIRILLRHNVQAALTTITRWAASPNEHVRRLASEGTRPFLPWGPRVPELQADPHATLPILDALRNDPSEYVRRSVANHLNDLSRHHADLVVDTARRWVVSADPNTTKTVKHGLRTLIKQGHPEALEVVGYGNVVVDVGGPELAGHAIAWGGTLNFSTTMRNDDDAPARLLIDYVILHRKANGSTSPKTFKWTTVELAPGEDVTLQRQHSFREITTRTYHPGPQAVAVQVNGVAYPPVEFELQPKTTSD